MAIVQPLALLQPASVPEPLPAVGPQVKQTQVNNAKKIDLSKLNIFKMHNNFYTQIAPTLVCAVLMDVSTPASTVPARRVSASLLLTKSIMENRSRFEFLFTYFFCHES